MFFLLIPPSILAVNDFWLGYHYSIGVSFSGKYEPDIDPPRLNALPMPSYPIELLRAAVQGNTVIEFVVKENGAVTNISVSRADAKEFGEEAKKVIAGWLFTPAKNRSSGKATAVRMECIFDFKLDEKTNK